MSYSQPQSQSQSYPSYQRTLCDNNQSVSPGWNSFDGTCPPSSAAAAADFENYTQFPLDPGGYNDGNLLAAEEQIPQSPNYSQYLNFDSMDTGPAAAGAAGAAGSSPAVMSQALFGTSTIAAVNPEQYVDFAIKIEQPEPEQLQRQQQEANMSLPTYSPSMNPNLNLNQRDNRVLARTCGAVPACAHILESPDLEMEDLNLGEWYPPSTISPAERDTQLSRQLGADDPRRKPSADDGTGTGTGTGTMTRSSSSSAAAATTSKKPRKRGRKPLADDDDEAQAQAQVRAKQAHSIVERRYRDNLNGKIMQLHRTLSSIAAGGGNQNRTAGDYYLDGDETATQKPQDQRTGAGTRVRKSDVMTDAVNYVHQSEVQMRHMENEISRLTDRVRTLEKLVRCEDCVVLKEMVRRSLQAEGRAQAQVQAQAQAQVQGRSHRGI
ncbi:hypothetical protein CLCR_04879 [Cladophialophora carrionii]|uniref:BHLH domain-containing protein n=1 Tax=Cladophialophora carrionii TaxID=86049 RepID=A0A1C1CK59_9EURO|nr:hypothetical protein CLCR_04879 [Cladophialophora carrionii]